VHKLSPSQSPHPVSNSSDSMSRAQAVPQSITPPTAQLKHTQTNGVHATTALALITHCCVRTSFRPRPASWPVLSIHSPVSVATPCGLDSQACQAGRSSGMQKLRGTIWKAWAPSACGGEGVGIGGGG
jgi:hypothetical protein